MRNMYAIYMLYDSLCRSLNTSCCERCLRPFVPGFVCTSRGVRPLQRCCTHTHSFRSTFVRVPALDTLPTVNRRVLCPMCIQRCPSQSYVQSTRTPTLVKRDDNGRIAGQLELKRNMFKITFTKAYVFLCLLHSRSLVYRVIIDPQCQTL